MAQGIQRETLEKLAWLESQQQEQMSALQKQLQGLSDKDINNLKEQLRVSPKDSIREKRK